MYLISIHNMRTKGYKNIYLDFAINNHITDMSIVFYINAHNKGNIKKLL